MNSGIVKCIFCMVAVSCFFPLSQAHAQFAELTQRIPDEANTIILINVDKLHESPLGKKEGWREKHDKAFQAGVAAIPPQSSKYVAAAKLDFATMKTIWEVAVMQLTAEPNMTNVANRYQGSTDKMQGREIAILPGDVYVVKFSSNLVGVGSPARRQEVSRWLGSIDNDSLFGLSSYLTAAEKFADKSLPIVMAVDLTDAFQVSQIRQALQTSEIVKGKTIDLDAISESLASIRGITLGITVNENRRGAIKVDFEKDITLIKDFAKPLLLQALENNGIMIDEFRDWNVKVSGSRIQIQGPLNASGMRRIFSLLDGPPSLKQPTSPQQTDGSDSLQQHKPLASQKYFQAIATQLNDLSESYRQDNRLDQVSVWFGKYARQIDRLYTFNVDDELVEYGKYVADSLRQGQKQLQSTSRQSRLRQQQVPLQYDVRSYSIPTGITPYGYYGWNGWRSVPNPQRTAKIRTDIREEERIRGNKAANVILQHIGEATVDIRRRMTKKYNVEF